MPHNYFFSNRPLIDSQDTLVCISEDEFYHATRVMRLHVGDELTIIDGKGVLAQGVIKQIEKQHLLAQITAITITPPPPGITLILGLQRLSHLEIALEKCTEVGATQFAIFVADKSEKAQITPTQRLRLETIIRSAVKQSGRLYLPAFTFFASLEEAVISLKDHTLYFGALDVAAPQYSSISPAQDKKFPKGLVIGPEAGFSQKELSFLRGHAVPMTLHENILRAETAAIVGCYKLYTMQTGCKMTDNG